MKQRLRVIIRGAVQGVGFRPFVFRLASELRLRGWVSNTAQGVFIEVDGEKRTLDRFLLRLQRERPPRSSIQSLEFSFLDPSGFETFEIRRSEESGAKTALVLPDIAACLDCLREIFDPNNRRHLYPFTNCTNCGPRFTIIELLPYDRPNTSMKKFQMCPACRQEYENPRDRRFHAQPNACPVCGPQIELWDAEGKYYSRGQAAISRVAEAILQGKTVAIKGLGGFHLMAEARNEAAVRTLRERKQREEKPLALMYPSIDAIKADCEVSELEERLLLSPEAPIVLLSRKIHSAISNLKSEIAPSVAPNNPYLGVMLPYTPLHHILMHQLGVPVVATSGNLSDEPICTDEHEAVERLAGIADLFLVHNRPIVRHVDDSVARVMLGRELVLRRARGYAPLPVQIGETLDSPLLAVGGHLKNAVALTVGGNAFISQHIGDLETPEALAAFRSVIADFQRLYEVKATHSVCDLHPDYLSTKEAQALNVELTAVQHHYAHVASCMAENQLTGEVLGVSWDGTGFGLDRTIWGGEFLLTTPTSFKRVASLRPFRLPGGDTAVKEPRRAAVGLLYEMFEGSFPDMEATPTLQQFSTLELPVIQQMLKNGINAPLTSSMGRLFDAVASLLGVRQRSTFEGQAAMELEFLAAQAQTDERYEFCIQSSLSAGEEPSFLLTIDWSPMVFEILLEMQRGIPLPVTAAKFHNTLSEMIVCIARRIHQRRIVLTGGCFQNKYLTERTVRRLTEEGFRPYWHQRVPPNDGGIALGQITAYARQQAAVHQPLSEEVTQ